MNILARKIDVRFFNQTPLDVCLDIWVRWQNRDDLSLGWRGRSVALDSDACADSEQLYDRMDNETAKAMETMIGDLKLHEAWAIKRRCGLATVWNFPRLIFADVLAQAELALEKKMQINIATRNYFK